jgi:hypothetical protein
MGYPVFKSKLDSERSVGHVSFRRTQKVRPLSEIANSVDDRTLIGVPESKSRPRSRISPLVPCLMRVEAIVARQPRTESLEVHIKWSEVWIAR